MTNKLKNYSTTPGSNNAASPDGWPEGQTAGSLNNGMREYAARVREWYQDAEWIDLGPTIVSSTGSTIVLSGDLTATYTAGRAIRINQSATLKGWITSSTYGAPNTTVNVTGFTVAAPTQVEIGAVTSQNSLPNNMSLTVAALTVPSLSTTTQSPGNNTTLVATTAYADAAAAATRLYDGVRETLATVTSTALAVIPDDDTVPDITEGTEIFSVSYTPTSAAIDLAIDAFIPGCGNDNYERIAAIFVGSTCISAVSVYGANGVNIILACSGIYSPANTSALTISVRVGSTATVNFYVNGGDNSGNRKLGGATKSTLTIREVTR